MNRRQTIGLAFLVGSAAAIAAVAAVGLGEIAALITAAGPAFAVVVPWGMVPVVFAAASWGLLFAPEPPPSRRDLFLASWAGLGANWLLPVAQIGGEYLKMRWAIQTGVPRLAAGAALALDLTLQIATMVVFALAGLLLLGTTQGTGGLWVPLLVATSVFTAFIAAAILAQRQGLFALAHRFVERIAPRLVAGDWHAAAAEIDRRVLALYRQRRRIMAAASLRLGFRVTLAGEIWLAMWALGHPITFIEAMAVESLVQVARSVAFFIPGALGAQEGALIALFAALGHPPAVALAVAAAKRIRELGVGLPALAIWQVREGKGLLQGWSGAPPGAS